MVPYVPAPEPALAGFAVDNTALDNGAIFSTKTRRLLGVHILGEGATELIHIGQAVLNLSNTGRSLKDRRARCVEPDDAVVRRADRRSRNPPFTFAKTAGYAGACHRAARCADPLG